MHFFCTLKLNKFIFRRLKEERGNKCNDKNLSLSAVLSALFVYQVEQSATDKCTCVTVLLKDITHTCENLQDTFIKRFIKNSRVTRIILY